MEKISVFFASKLAIELNLNEEKKQVIQYGIFAIIQVICTLITLVVSGMFFGVTMEVIIIMVASSTLRRYSGGAHATTPLRCLIIGTGVCLIQAFLVVLLNDIIGSSVLVLFLGVLIFILSYYMIFKYVPSDNSKKPIKSEEKKIRMKKGAKKVINMDFLIVLVLFIIKVSNIINYQKYIFCIYMGIVWQLFTITKVGNKLIYGIDRWFDININFLRKETDYEKN